MLPSQLPNLRELRRKKISHSPFLTQEHLMVLEIAVQLLL